MWNSCMGWGHGMMWGGLGGAIMMILWIAVIVAVIYLLIRAAQRNDGARSVSETALDILKKRYARGEISKEEFDDKKRDL